MDVGRLRTLPALLALASLLAAAPARGGDFLTLQASLTVLSANNCRFRTNAATLAFGNVSTAATGDALASGVIEIRCLAATPMATFFLSDNDGANPAPGNVHRMVRTAPSTAYLPYEFGYSPVTDTIPRLTWTPINLTGRIPQAALAAALPGSYTDTVTLTLLP